MYKDYESIPQPVKEFIMTFADADFLTEIPLKEINEWVEEHQEAFKLLIIHD